MAQYSNRQFFRKVPNRHLSDYFEAKGIMLPFEIDKLSESAVDEWQALMNGLEASLSASIEADFQAVNALATEGGAIALADEAGFHKDNAFIEEISLIEGFHAKAMWAFLNKQSYWRGAALFLHADNVSATYWKKRNDFEQLSPNVDDEDIDALANAISAYFFSKEGRGKNCKVEPYRRNEKEYFFAYPEDFAQSTIEWVGGSLKNQAHHPAFEIIFVYCEKEGSLDIYAPKNSQAVPELQSIFAKHILKLDNLSEWTKDKRVYELEPAIEKSFEFKIAPQLGIASMVVTSLRATLERDKKQRITVEANALKDEKAAFDLLESLNLPAFRITQLTIRASFDAVGNARAKTRTFRITYPNSCALNHDGNDAKIRQVLASSGLEPKALATND